MTRMTPRRRAALVHAAELGISMLERERDALIETIQECRVSGMKYRHLLGARARRDDLTDTIEAARQGVESLKQRL